MSDGDAVHGPLLSAGINVGDLPDAALWQGAFLLDGMFPGKSRADIEPKLAAWLSRYLDLRFRMESEQSAGVSLSMRKRLLRMRELACENP